MGRVFIEIGLTFTLFEQAALLLTTYYLPLTTYYLLLTTYYLLLTGAVLMTYDSLRTTRLHPFGQVSRALNKQL